MVDRAYQRIAETLRDSGTIEERMQTVADALWKQLADKGVSWVGFYLPDDTGQLVLGPSRNKPACSPIGMHGACGQVYTSGEALVVRNVRDLGESYVACDPRDQSEVVVPLVDADGKTYAVLDLDSFDIGAFDAKDVRGLNKVLQASGLTA